MLSKMIKYIKIRIRKAKIKIIQLTFFFKTPVNLKDLENPQKQVPLTHHIVIVLFSIHKILINNNVNVSVPLSSLSSRLLLLARWQFFSSRFVYVQ